MAQPSSEGAGPVHGNSVEPRPVANTGPPSLLGDGLVTATPDRDPSFAADLNLDQVVTAVAGRREEQDLITSALLHPLHDPAAVRYRQQIFRDLDDPGLYGHLQQFSGAFGEVRAHLRQLRTMDYRHQREGWFLDAAVRYCQAVQTLAGQLGTAAIRSPGLLSFRDYLTRYAASAGFTALARDTGQRRAELDQIRYCTRIRDGRVEVTRYQDEPDYSAAVLGVFERFAQGEVKDYRLRFRTEPGMNHIAAQILDLVARLFPGEFAALAGYCGQHAGFLDDGIVRADRELQFYLAYLDFIRPLRSAGLRFCYPGVCAESKDISMSGVFDLALARKLVFERKPVVTNDFELSGPERIFVVTGPNQGGKTTFARTFGQLHHLAACGCPVPGRAGRLFLPDRIFTHFAREEDITKFTGKLEDDLVRIAAIVRTATPASIVILNEIFASTTVHDARFLGTKLLRKIMQLGALGVYVTFVDELASLGEPVVSLMSTIVPGHPAERTYRVIRKPADGLAHALAIADKHGVSYDRLRERLAS